MLILITGGASSGKSEIAERLSVRLKTDRLYYIATMKIWDSECEWRVERHRKMRAGKGFETVECSENLYGCALGFNGGCALLDCLGNLLANEQFGENGVNAPERILRGIDELLKKLDNLVIVSNEVFGDEAEYDAESEKYIGNLGFLHTQIARRADIAAEICCGIPIVHKGEELFNEINA